MQVISDAYSILIAKPLLAIVFFQYMSEYLHIDRTLKRGGGRVVGWGLGGGGGRRALVREWIRRREEWGREGARAAASGSASARRAREWAVREGRQRDYRSAHLLYYIMRASFLSLIVLVYAPQTITIISLYICSFCVYARYLFNLVNNIIANHETHVECG